MSKHAVNKMSETCPLCTSSNSHHYHHKHNKDYLQCHDCDLVFVAATSLFTIEQEKAVYDLHQNSPDDQGYRKFLQRSVDALLPNIAPNAYGLDFGCGPGPTLSLMLEELGLRVENYDPIYFPNNQLLQQQYDFICSTEVLEHIYEPHDVITKLWQQLNTNGVLLFMTKRVIDQAAFAKWHYTNDPTHVRFYSESTFTWLSNQLGARLSFPTKDIAILQKYDTKIG